MFAFFSERCRNGLALLSEMATLVEMNEWTSFSKEALIDLLHEQSVTLVAKDAELQSNYVVLQTKNAELQTHRQQLREQDLALQTNDQTIEQLTQERDEYKLAWNRLLQQRFGNRSERYIANPDQLRIDFGDTDQAADAALGLADAVEELEQAIPAHKRRKPGKKRDESLPAHLPRYEVIADIAAETKTCPTHGQRTLLPESMWDTTETLEFERPKLNVRVTKYPKYACPNQPQCGIASPERPTALVEGNKYDSSIAAEIISGKYSYHLPLYRLQDYFAGSGWVPSRSTQCNILMSVCFVIAPLLEYFKRILQTDPVVGTDETRVTLLYPKTIPQFDLNDPKQRRMQEVFSKALEKKAASINARMWAYRGATIKLNVFDFTVSRHRDGPELFFAKYAGTLLGDCWHGFESIAVGSAGAIVRAACNAHARRKFVESQAYPQERALWLAWYRTLYEIEGRGAVMSLDERLSLRQTEAVPVWHEIESWLAGIDHRTTNVILPKSDLASGLQYVRNHLPELKRYLDDARIPIDNNETEQLMKQVAIGRKNWLFAGSVAGGERSAGLMTLASSALRNDLDVWQYVKDVLDQLLSGSTDYEPLLPWNWAATHPAAIRQYRVQERRDRTDRQSFTRAARRKNQPPN